MKVYIAVATGDRQYVGSLKSCYRLTRRDGDVISDQPQQRGDVGRDNAALSFLERREFDALLLLDGDQRHPPDMLERLRKHLDAGLDMVCAHYYRRATEIVQSLCYPIGDGTYPQLPYLEPWKLTGLHELLWTGFGCVLIHRRVLEAVASASPTGASPIGIGPLPETMGDHENAGPDCRFFLRARELGFRLWLDADIESLHATTIWLGHKSAPRLMDYTEWADGAHEAWTERIRIHGMDSEAFKNRLRILEARKLGLEQQYNAADNTDDKMEVSRALYVMVGHIDECNAWLKILRQYPPIEYPDQLPTTENFPAPVQYENTKTARQAEFKERAKELVEMLPDVEAAHDNGRAG